MIFLSLEAAAAERKIVYTYIGPVAGAGFNNILYNDWFQNSFPEQKTKKISGYFLTGGLTFCLISKMVSNLHVIGDFTVQFMHNRNERILQHLYYTISAKLAWTFLDVVTLAMGIGIYFETPPSNRKYNAGGGFRLPLALLFHTTEETRLFVEFSAMDGWYGLGEHSKKFFYGANLGFVFRVGRL